MRTAKVLVFLFRQNKLSSCQGPLSFQKCSGESTGTQGACAQAMAYALQGCGIVLRSDIEKRDKAYARVGRTAAQPVVSSLFIHSVWRVRVWGGVGGVHRESEGLVSSKHGRLAYPVSVD